MSEIAGTSEISYKVCPICKSPCTYTSKDGEIWSIQCMRCSEYQIGNIGVALFEDKVIRFDDRWRISSHIAENQGLFLEPNRIEALKANPPDPPKVGHCAERVLFFLAREHPRPGEPIRIDCGIVGQIISEIEEHPYNGGYDEWPFKQRPGYVKQSLRMLASGWVESQKQLDFLLRKYLHHELGYLDNTNEYGISAKGWDFIQNPSASEESNTVFVAMSFSSEMHSIYTDLIAPGIREAGYDPIRVDMKEHINRIDDEIISLIRQSKLIIADFTQQKNGVYFEAGFALGLNKPVIWMCEKDDLRNVHFDTRQYNTIDWDRDKHSENIKRIRNRIIAIVGRGRNAGPDKL